MKIFTYTFLLILLIINLSYRIEELREIKEKAKEILYLPKGEILKYLALDHRNTLSDFYWLQFIQYYGHHLQTDRKFPYMFSIVDIITDLDEKFLHAYTFGSVNLASDVGDREKSEALLMKAMYKNPERWEYPFWMGFLNYVFFKDYKKAATFFRISTLKDNPPDICFRFYAFTYYKKLKDLETALKLWIYMYEKAKSDVEKRIAEDYIKRTIMKIHMRDLTKILKEFIKRENYKPKNLKELLEKGYLNSIPHHPFGGIYFIKGDSIASLIPKK
ncbi:MAG: hypothetical protein ABDH37_00535 [Candidatus Hydrothermales bacterium]